MGRNFLERFKKEVTLNGISSSHFTKSCWETSKSVNSQVSFPYLIYRGLFLLYFLFWFTSSMIRDKNRHLWPIWATNLSLLDQMLYALIFFTNLSIRYAQQRRRQRRYRQETQVDLNVDESIRRSCDQNGAEEENEKAPTPTLNIFDSVTWFLLNIAGTIPFIVTLGYWLFVYDISVNQVSLGWDLVAHGINAILALIDILVIDIPIRMAHAVYTILFGLLYLVFSAVYEVAGGVYRHADRPYIYGLLNWRENPAWTLLNCAFALVAAFALHCFLWLLYKFRQFLVSKCCRQKDNVVLPDADFS